MNRVRTRGVSLYVETAGSGPPLVLLHGFTGSTASWAAHIPGFAERHTTVAIDLLGHGQSEAPANPERYRIEDAARDVLGVLDHLGVERTAVLGYSMGGRLALFLATVAPDRVGALVLESASPGLRDSAERQRRAAEDSARAEMIERGGVAAFVDRWEQHPMFASQTRLPEAQRAALRAQRLAQSAPGLANSLRGLGQGAQPSLCDRLPMLPMPTLLIVGALDPEYCALGREMRRLIPDAQLVVVPDAGHTVHLEQPELFRRAVLGFLEGVGGWAPGHTAPGHSDTLVNR